MRVSLLGAGSIGARLADLLDGGKVRGCELGAVVTSRTPQAEVVELLAAGSDVVVEAAGVEPARLFGPPLLAAGVDLVLCSAGVLADDDAAEAFDAAARIGGSRWEVPPGAVGGLDILRAAVRAHQAGAVPGSAANGSAGQDAGRGTEAQVRLTTVKRPEALGVQTQSRMVVFEGSARAAARRFPKTSNIAVTLAAATCGLDAVRVTVVADPAADRTRHEVSADTAVGSYRFQLVNDTLPGSGGRTSAITLWSVVTVLESLARDRRPVLSRSGSGRSAPGHPPSVPAAPGPGASADGASGHVRRPDPIPSAAD